MKSRISAYYLLLTACAVMSSCTGTPSGKTWQDADSKALPEGNKHATRFRLVDSTNYKILEITEPWQGAAGVTHRWYLVERNRLDPKALPDDGIVLEVPVTKIVCMSATHVAMVSALGCSHAIGGVSGTGLIFDKSVRKEIDAGYIREVGYDENINRELLVEMAPDIIVAYGVGSESVSHHLKLADLGLKVMYNADYLETDPLGKAEWIKVFGALFNKSALADSIFNMAVDEYNDVMEKVKKKGSDKPLVLLGLPWKESWYISPGNSYVSKLIEDAGGEYIWSDIISDFSMPFNIENVFIRAFEADYWLNPGTADNLSDIINVDHRLSALNSFTSGRVFNNNLTVSRDGANDYWETGSVRPGLILKDMAIIFSKDLFPDDTLRFYKQLR